MDGTTPKQTSSKKEPPQETWRDNSPGEKNGELDSCYVGFSTGHAIPQLGKPDEYLSRRMRATIEVYLFLAIFFFLNDGAPPKIVGK